MDECKKCVNEGNEYCFACDNGNQFKPLTHADDIRQMTDEELAEAWWKWIDCGECLARPDCSMLYKDCVKYALNWLRQEAK